MAPNRSHVQISITATAPTAAEAQGIVSARATQVINVLTPMVTNLQTVSLDLSPVYNFNNGTS